MDSGFAITAINQKRLRNTSKVGSCPVQDQSNCLNSVEITTKTIPLVTPNEVAEEIRKNLNLRKAPSFDVITGIILKKLQRKALVKLTTLINASTKPCGSILESIRSNHVTKTWKKPHRCRIILAICTVTDHVEVVRKMDYETS
jgi:hypothetical protein